MSEMVITGADGKPVVVTIEGELKVRSVQLGDEQHSIEESKTWNITTGQITLTDANPTVVQFIKNTTFEGNLIIPLYIFLTEPSTGGSGGDVKVEIIRNPTSGDIITNANKGIEVHQNFGGTKPFPGDHFKGATSEGAVTGQQTNDIMRSRMSDDDRLLLGIITYLPQGAAVAIQITPPTGNTSMVIESIMEIYEGSV